MATDWAAIETAIWTWVKNASGLPGSSVIWAHQDGSIPQSPYILMSFGEVVALGAVDELSYAPVPDGDPGADLAITSTGMRAFAVKLECFTGSVTGNGSPRALLFAVQTAAALPSARGVFKAVGISLFDRGTLQYVPAIRRVAFEARAYLEVRFYSVESVSELSTYIETVNTESFMGPPDSGTTDGMDI